MSWGCLQDDGDGPIHVVPCRNGVLGSPHVLNEKCVCEPDTELSDPDTGELYGVPILYHKEIH